MKTKLYSWVGKSFALWFVVFAFDAQGAAKRANLASLVVEGYDPLKGIISFLDVGITPSEKGGSDECVFLDPDQGTKASKQAWAPFDFYTNIADRKRQHAERAAGTLGEPNIFFQGDNGNRNGAADNYDWTRLVAPNFRGSLDFLEHRRGEGWFSFLVQFTRGKINYSALASPRTWKGEDGCEAALFHCTASFKHSDGTTHCEPDGWTRRLLQVIAEADIPGAVSDSFYGIKNEKEKNDIAAIYGVFQDVDNAGKPKGSAYREKVAQK